MCKETGACRQYQQAVGCEQNFVKFSFYLQALDWQAVLLTKIYIKRNKIEPIRAFKTFTNWLTCFQLMMELFWLFSLCPPLCSFDTDTPLFLFLTLDIRVKVNLMKFCFSFACSHLITHIFSATESTEERQKASSLWKNLSEHKIRKSGINENPYWMLPNVPIYMI